MTEDEITAVLDKANFCVESECAVDDVEDLINELKDQQKVLSTRLETIMNVVAHLQHANEQDARKTDDVRAIVKDMLRVFTTQVSCLCMLLRRVVVECLRVRGCCIALSYCSSPCCTDSLILYLFFYTSQNRMVSLPWVSVEILRAAERLHMMYYPLSHGRLPPKDMRLHRGRVHMSF